MSSSLSPPPVSDKLALGFPAEHMLLLTLNRPHARNAMTPTMSNDPRHVLNWFEGEPQLCEWCRAYLLCGDDLKAWNERAENRDDNTNLSP
ncbi:hypothetical protein AX14_001635 [Amanita brunnescens Koide BX004]|nr:hypothetical protein AX14_001635 [Amanita brunnescens Koide BX004]